MSRTAYVLDADGVVTTVTDYDAVMSRLFTDYQDGGNYRDEPPVAPSPAITNMGTYTLGSTTLAVVPEVSNLYATENSSAASATPTGITLAGVLPDSMSHTAPRAESRKQTRLSFFERLADFTVTAVAASNALVSVVHELGRGSLVTFSTADTLPAGLAAGTVYWVKEAGGGSFTVAAADPDGGTSPAVVTISDAGTGVHTCHALALCADFLPGEWMKWSNTLPVRI